MLRILIFLLFLCVVTPLPATAFECPEFESPTVTVSPLVRNPRYELSYDLMMLLAMGRAEDRTRFSSTETETPVGLTTAALKFETTYQIFTVESPLDHSVCAQVKSFNLDFGFDDILVYIASELPHNSCAFREVLDHEHKHVNTDRTLVNFYTPKFQSMFERLINSIGMIRAASGKEAERKIKNDIETYVHELSENLAAVRHKYQKQVDTKEEYERLRKSCNGEIERIIRKHR